MSILDKTAAQLGAAIKNGEVTVMQAVEASLSRIEKSESLYNCYVTVDREGALARALSPAFPLPSRTICVPGGFSPPVLPEYWGILSQPIPPRRSAIWKRRGP